MKLGRKWTAILCPVELLVARLFKLEPLPAYLLEDADELARREDLRHDLDVLAYHCVPENNHSR